MFEAELSDYNFQMHWFWFVSKHLYKTTTVVSKDWTAFLVPKICEQSPYIFAHHVPNLYFVKNQSTEI